MPSVVGIDPSSKKVALFCISEEGSYISHREWQADKKMSPDARPDFLYQSRVMAESYFSSLYGDLYVFIESPLVGRGGARSTIVQAQMQGVLLSAAKAVGALGVYEVNVQTWKKLLTGAGNANKEEVARWLRLNHIGFSEIASSQDLVDASCIALYGRDVLSRGSLLR